MPRNPEHDGDSTRTTNSPGPLLPIPKRIIFLPRLKL